MTVGGLHEPSWALVSRNRFQRAQASDLRMAKLRMILSLLFASAVVPAQVISAQTLIEGQHPQPHLAPDGYRYLLFIPRHAIGPIGQKWPLLFFLHGSGERGDEIAKVKIHGPPKIADRNPDFPFILIAPLLPADQDWDIAKLEAILDKALTTLPVDPTRVYLTGLSRGGHATWRWASAQPDKFAAIAPVAGRGDPATACALKAMPAWAFHGDRDDVVIPEGSFAIVRAISACGGAPRLTIYPDLGHNAWDPAYDDPALYLWLLSHRREEAAKSATTGK